MAAKTAVSGPLAVQGRAPPRSWAALSPGAPQACALGEERPQECLELHLTGAGSLSIQRCRPPSGPRGLGSSPSSASSKNKGTCGGEGTSPAATAGTPCAPAEGGGRCSRKPGAGRPQRSVFSAPGPSSPRAGAASGGRRPDRPRLSEGRPAGAGHGRRLQTSGAKTDRQTARCLGEV